MAYSELAGMPSLQCDLKRLAGMQLRGLVGRGLAITMNTSLDAVLVAVDHRRRVLACGEIKLMLRGTSAAQPSQCTVILCPTLQLADHGLGNKEADLDVLRRKDLHHGISRRDPFAFAVQRVEDQAVARAKQSASVAASTAACASDAGPPPPGWPAP